jgi:hypothetical protein
MRALPLTVAVWRNQPYGHGVHIIGPDGFPSVTLGYGRTALEAIEAAQDRAANLVRGLQDLHNAEVKGKEARL